MFSVNVLVGCAAGANSGFARLRETVRMLSLAAGLADLGADVRVSHPHACVRSAPDGGDTLETFRRLGLLGDSRLHVKPDVAIVPEQQAKQFRLLGDEHFGRLVVFKTSVGVAHDRQLLELADLLVAHEYDYRSPEVARSERLLAVPFPVGQLALGRLAQLGLLEAYLTDDLTALRSALGAEDGRRRGFGFIGYPGYGRTEAAQLLPDGEYSWTTGIAGDEYLRTLGGWRAGLHLAGDTPKANRFVELIVMGAAVIMKPCPVRNDPPVTDQMAIVLSGWDDRETLQRGLESWRERRDAAEAVYRWGWSPRGMASQIARKLGVF